MDIQHQGCCPWEDVPHGDHGAEEASCAAVVHVRVQGRDVELCQRGDRSIGQVARDFDLTETAVREWVRQAEPDAGTGDGGLTSAERRELAALRRENRQLREDLGVLKRATAFFSKETR
jgi:transposase